MSQVRLKLPAPGDRYEKGNEAEARRAIESSDLSSQKKFEDYIITTRLMIPDSDGILWQLCVTRDGKPFFKSSTGGVADIVLVFWNASGIGDGDLMERAMKYLTAYADDRGMLPENVVRLVRDFDRCRPWIEKALTYAEGIYDTEDVLLRLLKGEAELWPAENCFVITEMVQYPQARLMNFFLAGGETGSMEELERMLSSLEGFARDHKCDAVTLSGRPGWMKSFLASSGYRRQSVTMVKELSGEQNQENRDDL